MSQQEFSAKLINTSPEGCEQYHPAVLTLPVQDQIILFTLEKQNEFYLTFVIFFMRGLELSPDSSEIFPGKLLHH